MSRTTDPWSSSSSSSHQDFAIAGLAQGLIFPQKGLLNSRFFKSKSKAEDIFTERRNREDPDFIRVFVGTRKALQEWLKSAGPGSCSLWAEIAEEHMDLTKPDIPHRLFKAQLHLAYRLRSTTPLLQPVFPSTLLILSPQVSKGEGSLKMQEEEEEEAFQSPACGKWHSLRQREKEKFLKSIGVNHLGDHFCVNFCQAHQSILRSGNWIRRWLLGLPVSLYGQLASMIAPGGTLWQFQQIVEKIVHNSFFVDVDFELIDFRLWLKNHAYITILEGLDLLVVLSTLQWTAVRFDFAENEHIRIRGGKSLTSLHHCWQEKRAVDIGADGKRINEGALHPSDEKSGKSFCYSETGMTWKSWHPSDQECSLQCATLLDAMYKEGGFSESRSAGAFKQDFGFLEGREEQITKDFLLSSSRVQELRSCRSAGSPLLSSKEKCALSNLGSSSRIARQRGIHILLDILLGESKGKYHSFLADLRNDPSNGRGLSTPVSGSSFGNAISGSTPRSGDLSSNESSRALSGSEKGDYYKARESTRKQIKIGLSIQNDGVPSRSSPSHVQDMKYESSELQEGDTQRLPLSCDSRHAKEFECLDISRLFQVFCNSDYREVSCKLESVQMKLLEWVQGGFLECLIEEAICSAGKIISRKETGFSVEELADICLKTTSALPADSSIRIVDSMMLWLKDCNINKDLVNCIVGSSGLKPQEDWVDTGSDAYTRDSMIQKLGEELEKARCSAKLLLLLIKGSTFIASGIVRCGGLSIILDMYNCLVRLGISNQPVLNCPVPKIGCIKLGETLPGGVVDDKMAQLIVPSFSTSLPNGLRQQQIVNSITPRSVPSLGDQSAQHESFCMWKRNKCKVLAGRICKTVGRAILLVFLCKGRRMFALLKFTLRESRGPTFLSQSMPDTVNKRHNDAQKCTREPDDANKITSALPTVDKLEGSSETRPKVPKLMLKPCLSKERKKACDWTENSFTSMGTLSASSSSNMSSKTFPDCCAMVLEAKQYLLDAYNSLLLHRSAATVSAQQELAKKLSSDVQIFVSSFIYDSYNCFNSFPQSGRKLQDLIFEVMYQLDRLSAQTDFTNLISAVDDNNQGVRLQCELVGSEPLPTGKLDRIISAAFLQEILENLRAAFSSVVHPLDNSNIVGPENGDKCISVLAKHLHWHTDVHPLAFQTWQSISTLMCIIAECNVFSLKKGLPCLFKDFSGHFEGALALFSGIGEPSSWNLCQILAMQSLLNLMNVIFQGLRNDTVYFSTLWTDCEEQIWQMIITNKKNWACIKGYLSWLVLESCHGCFKNLLNYWKFYSDTPEALAILLFSKPGFCLESPGFGYLRDAFECLGFFVTLLRRRICAQLPAIKDGFSLLLPEDIALFLDFLMNPVDGLLMSTLKGPCFQGRIIHTEREMESLALDCRTMSQENIFLNNQDLDFSPSCKLSSAKLSATSTSDLSSSARALTDKDHSNRFATPFRCGILPVQSWSWQTPNRFKILNHLPHELNFKTTGIPRSTDAESPDNSLSSQLEHSQCSCKSCATRLILQALSLRISLLIEEKSLALLAQVFSLKFTPNIYVEQLHGVKTGKALENPFLSKKYVDAFLDFHFLSFLQLYNWKTNDYQNIPIKQHSVLRKMDGTCQTLKEEGSTNLNTFRTDTLHTMQNASPDIIASLLSEDETISLACQKHGEVLVALSQNQTRDVSRRFKELKIMDFLMNQIALEYELSHVVTPRKSVPEFVSCEALQTKDQTSVNIIISKCKANEESLVGKSNLSKERKYIESLLSCSIRNSEEPSQISQESQRKQLTDAIASCHVNKTGRKFRQNSGRILHDTQSGDVDSLKISHLSGLVGHNSSLQHQLLKCISVLQMPVNQHGSFTCRAGTNLLRYSFPFAVNGDVPSIGIKKNCCSMPLQQQELINFYFRLPGVIPRPLRIYPDSRKAMKRHQVREIPFEKKGFCKCSDKSHNQCSCFDLNQYESSSFLFNEENFGGSEVQNCTKEIVVVSSKTGSSSYRKSARNLMDAVNHRTTYVTQDKIKGSQGFVYSGRFCDLNEEVENELEKEDAEICHEKSKNRAGFYRRAENAALKSGKKVSVGSPRSNVYADQQSKKKAGTSRPLVPKLNLPKSARKGDELEKPVEGQEKDISTEKQKVQETFSSENGYCRSSEVVSEKGSVGSGNKIDDLSYERERTKRRMYRDCKLHVLLLELFVSLMVTPQGGLETCYTDRFPMEGQKMNAPFYLLYHINHIANAELWPSLRNRMKSFHPSVFRILKLLWRDLFDSSLYTNRQRIAHGAFAQVYTATFTESNGDSVHCKSVVLKTVNLPKGPHEPCKFFDIYSEVEILEKFTGDPRICQLLDYGVDIESFILVLKHYKCSLRYWRQRHNLEGEIRDHSVSGRLNQAFYNKLPLYLEVYSSVLQAVKVLESHNVVHYDLKCDNILLEPVENIQSEEEFWNPVWCKLGERSHLPFRVCIADFGQSKASILKGGECTVRNRGTECVKSPEMLKLLSTIKQDDTFLCMPAKDESVGRAVDVWGLGCLLYELLTGEYLLYDEDWTRFFIRVTLSSEDLITDEKAAKLDHYKPIMEFLHFVLVRDPLKRPTLDAVILQLEQLQLRLRADDIGSNLCIAQGMVDGSSQQKLTPETCDIVSDMMFMDESSEQGKKPMLEYTCFSGEAKNSSSCQEVLNESSTMQCTTITQDSKVQASSASPSSPWWKRCLCKFICGG